MKEETKDTFKEKWKSLILGINDKREIEYIQSLCRARVDLAEAEYRLEKVDKKIKEGPQVVSEYHSPPNKMKPFTMAKEVGEAEII